MVAVFEHNLHDVLSLVALTCRLGRLLDGQPAPAPADDARPVPISADPARSTDPARASSSCSPRPGSTRISGCWRRRTPATSRRSPPGATSRCGRGSPAGWRRSASGPDATSGPSSSGAASPPLGLTGCEPFVELAKHFEHRQRDYDAAINVVEEALAVSELRVLRRQPGAAAERAALEHRLARLLAKRGRSAPSAGTSSSAGSQRWWSAPAAMRSAQTRSGVRIGMTWTGRPSSI